MKRLIMLCTAFFSAFISVACPVCEQAQPKFLRGIAHGAGPDGNSDYLIVLITAIIVIVCLYYSLRCLFTPEEANKDHIKNMIINNL